MSFARVAALADAVLLEGYVLYPYRASSKKNRFRWTFGVLTPRAWSEAGGCESWWLESQCLVEPTGTPRLEGRLRFLQSQQRRVEQRGADGFAPADTLQVGNQLHLPWDEGKVCDIDFELPLEPGVPEASIPFEVAGGTHLEVLRDEDGSIRGRVVRERTALRGVLRVGCERVEAERPLWRIRVRAENTTPWEWPDAPREVTVRAAMIATHLLLRVENGGFVSLLDPPEWATAPARECKNTCTWPVLAGEPGRRDLVLSAPIVLYDHAQIAPESPGDFFDATEVDEMLRLRTALLTDEEKREARATDPRAAALIDRVDHLPPEMIDKLHGTFRDLHRAEMVPKPSLPAYERGTRVRLKPGKRRTDAQDLLFVGSIATVESVLQDVDGRTYVAVTLDADPAADFNRWFGRYHYYELDEVEPA